MNLQFSTALAKTGMKYGYMYNPDLRGDTRYQKNVTEFMDHLKTDFMIHEGLKSDIQQEKKRAQMLLKNSEIKADGSSDHIKHIFHLRIQRKQMLYDFYANIVLSYMNNLIYEVFDAAKIKTKLGQADGDPNSHMSLSGMTAEDAYKESVAAFKGMLKDLQDDIEQQFSLKNLNL